MSPGQDQSVPKEVGLLGRFSGGGAIDIAPSLATQFGLVRLPPGVPAATIIRKYVKDPVNNHLSSL